jgi:hypothetical protein
MNVNLANLLIKTRSNLGQTNLSCVLHVLFQREPHLMFQRETHLMSQRETHLMFQRELLYHRLLRWSIVT